MTVARSVFAPATGKPGFLRPFYKLLGRQDYIKMSLRKRWISHFHDPETAVSEPFETGFYGFRYRGNFNSTLDWYVYYLGVYAKEELHLLRDLLACFDAPVVFDGGGNCGHHALYLSRLARTVHTFEPFPPLAAKIREKIADNGRTNIVVHELAIGDAETVLPYYPPDDNHIGLGSFVARTTAAPVELRVVRTDDLFPDDALDRLDLVKLDLEGFEVGALRGMAGLLGRHRPAVFLEWSDSNLPTLGDAPFLSLFPQGYRGFVFHDYSWKPRLRAFRQPGYGLEPFEGAPPLANLLIVPEEFVERCRAEGKMPALFGRRA